MPVNPAAIPTLGEWGLALTALPGLRAVRSRALSKPKVTMPAHETHRYRSRHG
ncbi:hypothetical protein ALDI51_05790 [Alicycliphilus denitrificans]|uniref:hypothetical protein n=1 Tax=Alicycliphilus denitrificans TaxID=179636 RepID=UPI003085EE2B|nr:hypothetical protein ALDI51_05790 [Alicycliphilus denitrificans]